MNITENYSQSIPRGEFLYILFAHYEVHNWEEDYRYTQQSCFTVHPNGLMPYLRKLAFVKRNDG